MIEILKFELRKLLRMKSLYVCAILILSVSFSSILMTRLGDAVFNVQGDDRTSMWYCVLSASSDIKIPLAVFISLYALCDMGNDTLKNIISRGYSRTYIFLSQLIVVVMVSVGFFVLCEVSDIAFGAIFLKAEKADGRLWGSIFLQLAAIVAYGGFYFGIASLFKGIGGAIATAVLSDVMVMPILFGVGDALIIKYFKDSKFRISTYWLGNILSDSMTLELTNKIVATALIGSAAYFVIFVAIGYLIARRREV